MTRNFKQPARGFPESEFKRRTENLQHYLTQHDIGVAFFTNKAEVQYFSGYNSNFWLSPARPWFLVIPSVGKPIAVIPEIGKSAFEKTWLSDIRTWQSPQHPFDGISLLSDTLKEHSGKKSKIGAMLGNETYLRMAADNFAELKHRLHHFKFADISHQIHQIRSIKSKREIDKIRYICLITEACFSYLKGFIHIGMSERDICKEMQTKIIQMGADNCPYIVTASGNNGYDGIIEQATDRILRKGDLFVLDTGAEFDGYFSDFNRNYSCGELNQEVLDAYDNLHKSIENALNMIRPGISTLDIVKNMQKTLGSERNTIGRMGHGLGIEITEWPSNSFQSYGTLQEGFVITLEPSTVMSNGKMIVFEENIVITDTGYELLHPKTWNELPIVKQKL